MSFFRKKIFPHWETIIQIVDLGVDVANTVNDWANPRSPDQGRQALQIQSFLWILTTQFPFPVHVHCNFQANNFNIIRDVPYGGQGVKWEFGQEEAKHTNVVCFGDQIINVDKNKDKSNNYHRLGYFMAFGKGRCVSECYWKIGPDGPQLLASDEEVYEKFPWYGTETDALNSVNGSTNPASLLS